MLGAGCLVVCNWLRGFGVMGLCVALDLQVACALLFEFPWVASMHGFCDVVVTLAYFGLLVGLVVADDGCLCCLVGCLGLI